MLHAIHSLNSSIASCNSFFKFTNSNNVLKLNFLQHYMYCTNQPLLILPTFNYTRHTLALHHALYPLSVFFGSTCALQHFLHLFLLLFAFLSTTCAVSIARCIHAFFSTTRAVLFPALHALLLFCFLFENHTCDCMLSITHVIARS